MRIAYLDCVSGMAGDMMLGALVDAGVELSDIDRVVSSLGLPGCRLVSQQVKRRGFRATKVSVEAEPEHKHRHLHHIMAMIDGSQMTATQRDLAKRIFTRLGEAEAKVHGTTIEKVHFHEVGAVDSIADICGTAIGWDLLGHPRLVCSPVPVGSGFIEIAHGRCSVPAPATAELLRGVPIATSAVVAELTTPTGAAIIATLAESFGAMPPMAVSQIGYGSGDKDFAEQANIVRLFVGESTTAAAPSDADEIVVLETNLDDVTGEMIGYCIERLWEAGALDVYTTAITMKKNRPATKITVLAGLDRQAACEEILGLETGTLGIRRWLVQRHKLPRESMQVMTAWGAVAGKRIRLPDGSAGFTPEYEACRQLALTHRLPLSRVYESACEAFRGQSRE
ncbi:MAG: nickel pincer cofactor biosynthesis protein LarC [Pirellulales bacterium]